MTDTTITCRGSDCKARIRIVLMESGNRMPVDLEPAMDGRILALPDGRYRALKPAEAQKYVEETGQPLLRSHFASCPNGPKFRQRSAATR